MSNTAKNMQTINAHILKETAGDQGSPLNRVQERSFEPSSAGPSDQDAGQGLEALLTFASRQLEKQNERKYSKASVRNILNQDANTPAPHSDKLIDLTKLNLKGIQLNHCMTQASPDFEFLHYHVSLLKNNMSGLETMLREIELLMHELSMAPIILVEEMPGYIYQVRLGLSELHHQAILNLRSTITLISILAPRLPAAIQLTLKHIVLGLPGKVASPNAAGYLGDYVLEMATLIGGVLATTRPMVEILQAYSREMCMP